MVGAVPSMVGLVPSMVGVVPSMVGVVPSKAGVVPSMVGVVEGMGRASGTRTAHGPARFECSSRAIGATTTHTLCPSTKRVAGPCGPPFGLGIRPWPRSKDVVCVCRGQWPPSSTLQPLGEGCVVGANTSPP